MKLARRPGAGARRVQPESQAGPISVLSGHHRRGQELRSGHATHVAQRVLRRIRRRPAGAPRARRSDQRGHRQRCAVACCLGAAVGRRQPSAGGRGGAVVAASRNAVCAGAASCGAAAGDAARVLAAGVLRSRRCVAPRLHVASAYARRYGTCAVFSRVGSAGFLSSPAWPDNDLAGAAAQEAHLTAWMKHNFLLRISAAGTGTCKFLQVRHEPVFSADVMFRTPKELVRDLRRLHEYQKKCVARARSAALGRVLQLAVGLTHLCFLLTGRKQLKRPCRHTTSPMTTSACSTPGECCPAPQTAKCRRS